METLRIGPTEYRFRLPHPLWIASALTAWTDGDRAVVSTAFLGYCLPDAPRRFPSEDWYQYGIRVYDWLRKDGADHWQIVRAAADGFNEACSALPAPPTRAEVAQMGGPSGGEDSTTGSSSPTDGPATPSGGSR